jgi:hypothetical protein
MNTLFVLKGIKVISSGCYERIIFLDADEFEKLDRCKDEERFIAGLSPKQIRVAGDPK